MGIAAGLYQHSKKNKYMKRLIVCLGLVLFLSNTVKAQISNDISEDSVKSLLCHKWGYRAAIMGGQEIKNLKESVTYQFYKDNTVHRVTSKGKNEYGKWTYDRQTRLITIKIKNKSTLYVLKLEPGDLVVSANQVGAGVESEGLSLGVATALKLIGE